MARYRRRHDRDTPRGWFSLFVRLGGWAAMILGAAVVVTTTFSAGALFLADKFDREGALAYAVVTGKRVGERQDANGDTRQVFLVEFTYKVRGGGSPAGRVTEAEVTAPYFNRTLVEEEVPIRYLVSDPSRVEADIGYYRGKGELLRWTGLALGIGGLIVLWLTGSRTNRAILARRDGDKRLASVTSIEQLRLTVRGARQGRLHWREEDGRTGASLAHPVQWLRDRYRPGDRIVVFRLGDFAVWEGDVGPPERDVARLRPPPE